MRCSENVNASPTRIALGADPIALANAMRSPSPTRVIRDIAQPHSAPPANTPASAGRDRLPAVKSTMKRDRGPLSVTLPDPVRRRLEAQARRRGLKVATAARLMIVERLDELDETMDLEQAERWQLAEVMRTWERIRAGDWREVPRTVVARSFASARRKVGQRARRTA